MSADKPLKISIAMATYNGGKYLQEQLNSFLAQARLPNELVITDDCSTDNTLEIIQAFAATAPFEVRWEQNEKNLGYTGNFNQALMKTTGDLVFLSDQDDVWFPEKLKFIETLARTSPGLLFLNDAQIVNAEGLDAGFTKFNQVRSAKRPSQSLVIGCCMGIKRELLDICLSINTNATAHDTWISNIAEYMKKRVVIPVVLQSYRRHSHNVSHGLTSGIRKRGIFYALYYDLKKKLFISDLSNHLTMQLNTMNKYKYLFYYIGEKSPDKLYIKNGLSEIEREVSNLKKRLRISKRLRIYRIFPATKLFICGGYRSFSVFMRDLIIR